MPHAPSGALQRSRSAHLLVRFLALSLVLAGILHLWTGPSGQPIPTVQAGPLADPPGPVDPQIAKELAAKGEATFFVLLDQQANLAPAYAIGDWTERGRYVLETLQRTAASSQAPLLTLLRQRQTSHGDVLGFQPLFITNAVLVTAREGAVPPILNAPGVVRLAANQVLTIPVPQPAASVGPTAVEWGVSKIGADAVWNQLSVRGNGIVVANIDTGVQYDHPALVRQYRGRKPDSTFDHNYNWWDPAKVCGNPSLAPCDNNNHGTHTMGTMLGDDGGSNRIGVAPEATWIAAKGCESGSCSLASLISAGQWVLAPTNLAGQNPDPAKRPHIVNNSWGGGSGSLFYDATVRAWHAAGIFPAFAAGNSGSGCSTSNSPGDYPLSFASGATNGSDAIASFSSRGPAYWGGTKPDVAAPGVGVRSSIGNSSYASFSGTSMASPHSAGLVALVWSAGPQLIGRITDTVNLLKSTASGIANSQCGTAGPPNNVYGSGRIQAAPAVNQASTAGFVTGTVRAADGAALSGVAVSLSGNTYSPRSTTDGSGRFALTAGAGDYTATTAPPYGYQDAPTPVHIQTGLTTNVSIVLASAPLWPLAGTVREAVNGLPLQATVHPVGGPMTTTTDSGGAYSLSVPQGTFLAEVRAPLHRDLWDAITVTGPLNRSFALAPGGAFGCSDCPRPAPDLASVTSTINVTLPIVVGDVTLEIDLLHTWIGDLVLRLISPQGKSVTLHNRTGSSAHNIKGNYDISLPVNGPGSLNDFNGDRADGPWRLAISDQALYDSGMLQSWTLHVTGTVVTPNLLVSQETVPRIPLPGQPLTYVITVTNSSAVTASLVSVADTLPQGVSLLSAEGATASSGVLSWPAQDLPPAASRSLRAQLMVGAISNGTVLTNRVQLNSPAAYAQAPASASSTLVRGSWRSFLPLATRSYAGGW